MEANLRDLGNIASEVYAKTIEQARLDSAIWGLNCVDVPKSWLDSGTDTLPQPLAKLSRSITLKRDRIEQDLRAHCSNSRTTPTVVIAPTGTGKTTEVPLALANILQSRVFVVEPNALLASQAYEYVKRERAHNVEYLSADNEISGDTAVVYTTANVFLSRVVVDARLKRTVQALVIDEYHVSSASYYALRVYALESMRDIPVLFMTATSPLGRGLEADRAYTLGVEEVKGPTIPDWSMSTTRAHPWHPQNINARTLIFCADANEIYSLRRWYTDEGVETMVIDAGNYNKELPGVIARLRGSKGRALVLLTDSTLESGMTLPIDIVVDGSFKTVPSLATSSRELLWRKRPITRFESLQRAGRAGRLCKGLYYRVEQALYADDELELHHEFHAYLWLVYLGMRPIKKIFENVAKALEPMDRVGAALLLNCYIHPVAARLYMDDSARFFANTWPALMCYSHVYSQKLPPSNHIRLMESASVDWFEITVRDRLSSSGAMLTLSVPFKPNSYCSEAMEHISYEMHHWDQNYAGVARRREVEREEPRKLVVKAVHRAPSRDRRDSLRMQRSASSLSVERSVLSEQGTSVSYVTGRTQRGREGTPATHHDSASTRTPVVERRKTIIPGEWVSSNSQEGSSGQKERRASVVERRPRAKTSVGSFDDRLSRFSAFEGEGLRVGKTKDVSLHRRALIGGGKVARQADEASTVGDDHYAFSELTGPPALPRRMTTTTVAQSRPVDMVAVKLTYLIQPIEMFRTPGLNYTEYSKSDSKIIRRVIESTDLMSVTDASARLKLHDSYVRYWNHLVVKRAALESQLVMRKSTLMRATSSIGLIFAERSHDQVKEQYARTEARMHAMRTLYRMFRSFYFGVEHLVVSQPRLEHHCDDKLPEYTDPMITHGYVWIREQGGVYRFETTLQEWCGFSYGGVVLTVQHALTKLGKTHGDILYCMDSNGMRNFHVHTVEGYDLALLYAEPGDHSFEAALFSVCDNPRLVTGLPVVSGHIEYHLPSSSWQPVLYSGVIVSSIASHLVVATYPSRRGDSGQPIMTNNGEIVGVHLGRDQNTGYSCFLSLTIGLDYFEYDVEF